jgi:hypothetical protein
MENENERMLFVFNQTADPTAAAITLPFPISGFETIYSGDSEYAFSTATLRVSMQGREVLAFKIKKE